jgi:predicted acyltransferase
MATVSSSQRLYSLDALRGFDMFWIIGGGAIIGSLTKATGSPFWSAINEQLEHPAWHGFHFYDLIFPTFLFMAGVATPYSLGRKMEMGKSKQKLLLTVIRRGLTLVLLGLIVNNHLRLRPFAEIRFGSVLGHIGVAYMFANIIFLYSGLRAQIIWFFSILIGYWMLFLFFSAPGFPHGDLTMQGNIVSYIDRLLMPGKLYLGIHDPEGLTSTVPAISTALLGIFAGDLLKNSTLTGTQKTLRLLILGIIFIIVARIWNPFFPINKNLWTSSFMLYTGGMSLILLSIFYYIIDVRGYKSWAFFFKVIGMNSILIYISGQFIDFSYTANGFFQWLIQLVGDPFGAVVLSLCVLGIKWLFLYFLYKKNVFLRV